MLDNFEHLLTPPQEGTAAEVFSEDGLNGAEGLLSEMIQAAPQLKLLVTSRERLNLQEEWLVEVKGLPYPSLEGENGEALEAYSAVQLFLQRASRHDLTLHCLMKKAPTWCVSAGWWLECPWVWSWPPSGCG